MFVLIVYVFDFESRRSTILENKKRSSKYKLENILKTLVNMEDGNNHYPIY